MATAPPALQTCSECQSPLDPNGTCPRCRAPQDWNDHIEGIDFVLRRLRDWHQRGQLSERQLQKFEQLYGPRRNSMQTAVNEKTAFVPDASFARSDDCWSCSKYLYTNSSHCHSCGAPVTDPGVKSLRYWRYLLSELQAAEESGLLTLRQGHEFIADTQERMAALTRKLENGRAPFVIPVTDAPPPKQVARRRPQRQAESEPEPESVPRRPFIEVITDPNTIRWLLAAGGGLIVVGLVIWLISLGVFDNPAIVAVMLGTGNALLVAGGWLLILKTRFQHAGLALTLLACLVMPLNLWFYHSNNLLTLEQHLWMAALVCCGVYVASALLLRDSLFVYVLVGGITLTMMLVLGQTNRFGEVFAPSMCLVVLGLICLHVERAFPPTSATPAPSPAAAPPADTTGTPAPVPENPFSREQFGMAFFWSSQALFAAGLLLLLGAQLYGWLHSPLFRHFGLRGEMDVVKTENLPWTLFIVLMGTYSYIYSDLVVRRIGVYLYLAAITVLWAEIHVLEIIQPARTLEIIIVSLSITALVINVLHAALQDKHAVVRVVIPLGLILSLVAVALGTFKHFGATNTVLHAVGQFEISEWLIAAMAVTAITSRIGAYLNRHTHKEISVVYFFATAAATLVGAAGLTWALGLKRWEMQAPLLMLIPIAYLAAAHFYKGRSPAEPLLWCAQAATVVMIVSGLWSATAGQVFEAGDRPEHKPFHLLLALFCLEAAVFYGAAGVLHRSQTWLYLAAVMFGGAVWQVLWSFDLPIETYPVVFSATGFVLLILYRFGLFERFEMPNLERGLFQSACALLTLGFVAGALMSLFKLPLPKLGDWHDQVTNALYVQIFMIIISLASALLVQQSGWRRAHLVLSVINAVLLVLLIHKLSELGFWRRAEIISIVVGIGLLIAAFTGWYRETEKASDLVSFAFLLGSLGVVVPPLIAILVHRINKEHAPGLDDLAVVIGAILLFGSGVLCRIMSTTLTGAIGMLVYLLVILISLMHGKLQDAAIVGIYLALGGGVLFGTGIGLSVYRDRLLALPEKVKRREGIFKVFGWR